MCNVPSLNSFFLSLRNLNARGVVLAALGGSAEDPYLPKNILEVYDTTCRVVILQTSTTTSAITNVTTNNYPNKYNDTSSILRNSNTSMTTKTTNCITPSTRNNTNSDRSGTTCSCKIILALRYSDRAGKTSNINYQYQIRQH